MGDERPVVQEPIPILPVASVAQVHHLEPSSGVRVTLVEEHIRADHLPVRRMAEHRVRVAAVDLVHPCRRLGPAQPVLRLGVIDPRPQPLQVVVILCDRPVCIEILVLAFELALDIVPDNAKTTGAEVGIHLPRLIAPDQRISLVRLRRVLPSGQVLNCRHHIVIDE